MPSSEGIRAVPHEHAVRFYEDDSFLDEASEFLGRGLRAGDAGLVIATEEHRHGLEERIRRGGFDLGAARASGRYRPLDAAETMSQFMVGGVPDERQFRKIVGEALASARDASEGPGTRVFGEMVALLCAQGFPEAALRVERMWNELAGTHSFSLLCAYPIGGFAAEDPAKTFVPICEEHNRVVPAETFQGAPADDRQSRVIAQLQQKAAALESEVARRREAEAALLQRERELAELNRRKDEFLAMLGHELRNPMAPIMTALHVLALRPNDPELRARSLGVVERNFQRVTRLVDDLLDVSRITSGKIELREETVAIAAVVERAAEQSRAAFEERGHSLLLRLPDEPISLRADPARLEQILVNLLVNAAKYTDFGGRIELSVAREGDAAEIRVSDSGVGMAPSLRGQIFGLFVQGPNASHSSPARAGGLGVGLTLVRRLVELHGGSVEAKSGGEGLGSEFVVRLPIRAAQPAAAGESATARAPHKSKRILVVDDNRDAAEGLTEYLRAIGHEVCLTTDGPGAIAEAGRMRPELIFLDIGMPGMNGHEVARRLRANGDLSGCVLVALTGYGQDSDRRSSLAAGFDHHLVKPVDLRKLESLLAPPG